MLSFYPNCCCMKAYLHGGDHLKHRCYMWIGNDSVNYAKLCVMEKQSLLIHLQESPPMHSEVLEMFV